VALETQGGLADLGHQVLDFAGLHQVIEGAQAHASMAVSPCVAGQHD
jgi:hypothetical protein